MNIQKTLIEGTRLLRLDRVDVPKLTARVLLAHALGRDQPWLIAHSNDQVDPGSREDFLEMVRARCSGVPTQYIRGTQEFYGIEFRVTSDVLIPRPETEHLVEAALARIRPQRTLVDIGTGSGAVAVAVAKHTARVAVFATDISLPALRVASGNARRASVDVHFCAGDLCELFRATRFDMVVSNPPYVPRRDSVGLQRELHHEPALALYGGEDGLQVVRRIVAAAPRVLKQGGWLLLEIGFGTRPALDRILDSPEWDSAEFLPDLAGIDRVVAVRRSSRRT